MNAREAIARRKSIRRFKDEPVEQDTLLAVLQAGVQAPSGKNRQPWRFIVVQGDKRAEMVGIMREAISALKAQGIDTGSSEWTAKIMERAPVTIFVFNAFRENVGEEGSIVDVMMNLVDVQSIGAAIQNMLLAACDLGLGTLWICDVYYAYEELCGWLGETHQMIAAVSLGYPDETPGARPRKAVDEVTRWL